MENIGQQLDLGRGGPKVRKVEDGVMQSLDKIIKKLEDEQQQAAAAAGGNGLRPATARRRQPAHGQGPRPGQV